MLEQGSYPVLDFDDDLTDPIGIGGLGGGQEFSLPQVAVLAILGDKVNQWAKENGAKPAGKVDYITTEYPIWIVERDGAQIAVVECPIGAPAAVMMLESLIARGVRSAILTGSCGVLTHANEGEFLIPHRAMRDEGTSYHYQPAGKWISTDEALNGLIRQALREAGQKAREVTTWTTDAIHRETAAVVERRRTQGCAVVEMECASMAACAKLRQVRFGQLLFTADSLAGSEYQPRGWGTNTHLAALELAVDAGFLAAAQK